MSAYREAIIELYKNPLNNYEMEDASTDFEDSNPLCGDQIHVWVKVNENGVVEKVSFKGTGCAISQASTSLLTEELPGMTIEEVEALDQDDIQELLGIPLSPVRLKCALLGQKVIQGALLKYKASKRED